MLGIGMEVPQTMVGMEVLQTMLGMMELQMILTILYLMPFGHFGPTAEGLLVERLWNSAGFVIFDFLFDELLVVTMKNG